MKIKDLSGKVFGKWKVIEFSHCSDNGVAFWVVECSCGFRKSVARNNLTSGASTGCRSCKTKPQPKDIAGRIFGYLTVIEFSGIRRDRAEWVCQCICGNKVLKLGNYLETNVAKGFMPSCGCMACESSKINLSGSVFTRITVLYPFLEEKGKDTLWLCICDCGTEIIRTNKNFLTGTGSCGCLNREVASASMKKYLLENPPFGPNNNAWKGGITPLKSIIRSSSTYNYWRGQVFARDNKTCQDCSAPAVHAHHIIHFSDILNSYNITTLEEAMDCDLLWDISNGVAVCGDCHADRHLDIPRGFITKEVSPYRVLVDGTTSSKR